jgi:hypothetical protein
MKMSKNIICKFFYLYVQETSNQLNALHSKLGWKYESIQFCILFLFLPVHARAEEIGAYPPTLLSIIVSQIFVIISFLQDMLRVVLINLQRLRECLSNL